MIKFDLIKEVEVRISKKFLQNRMDKLSHVLEKRIDKLLMKRNGQIDLILVDDKTIHAINLEYRKKDKATDVISFAYLDVTEHEQSEGDVVVGDIFISIDTAHKQAKKKGHSWKREVEILFVHGLLHCLGFDHKNDKEEAEMEEWAKKVLE